MPDLATLTLFAAACLALAATPGPDMLLIASRSVGQGRAAGFASLAGVLSGIYCHALAAALGLSQLFLVVPVAYDIVRWAGAAYLLYLAWRTLRSEGTLLAPSAGIARQPVGRIFRQGLITNLLNPKMALFVLALFPQFIRQEAGPVAVQILVLATVLNVIGLGVNGAVILTASRLGRALGRRGRWQTLPRYLLASVFFGLACRLAIADRR